MQPICTGSGHNNDSSYKFCDAAVRLGLDCGNSSGRAEETLTCRGIPTAQVSLRAVSPLRNGALSP